MAPQHSSLFGGLLFPGWHPHPLHGSVSHPVLQLETWVCVSALISGYQPMGFSPSLVGTPLHLIGLWHPHLLLQCGCAAPVSSPLFSLDFGQWEAHLCGDASALGLLALWDKDPSISHFLSSPPPFLPQACNHLLLLSLPQLHSLPFPPPSSFFHLHPPSHSLHFILLVTSFLLLSRLQTPFGI